MACWANIDKNSGSKNTILNIYSGENETGADRSVRIKVSSPDGKISGTYTLVHKKKRQPVYKNVRKSKTFVKKQLNSNICSDILWSESQSRAAASANPPDLSGF